MGMHRRTVRRYLAAAAGYELLQRFHLRISRRSVRDLVHDRGSGVSGAPALAELLAQDAREVLQAWVEPFELRQVVRQLVGIPRPHLPQLALDLDDVHQVPVLVQLGPVEPKLQHVVVRVALVVRPPIPSDQKWCAIQSVGR
jgi:hypothetical protein